MKEDNSSFLSMKEGIDENHPWVTDDDQTHTFYKANVRSLASFLAHLSLKLKLLFLFLLEPINKFVTTDIIKLNSRKTNVIVIGF